MVITLIFICYIVNLRRTSLQNFFAELLYGRQFAITVSILQGFIVNFVEKFNLANNHYSSQTSKHMVIKIMPR